MSALASAMESNGLAWSHACVGACAEVKVGDFGLGLHLARADGAQPEPWRLEGVEARPAWGSRGSNHI